MLDAAFVILTMVFFVTAMAYVAGCRRLGGD